MPSQDKPSSLEHQHPHQHDHGQEHSHDHADELGHGATTCAAPSTAIDAPVDRAKSSCGTACCSGSQTNLNPVTDGAQVLDSGLMRTPIRINQMDCPT